jgi:hypothetical protein
MAGCRCVPCRAANSNYEVMRDARRRQGLWNGLVPADRARAHILKLSKQGVGYKTIGQLARISKTVMWKIRSGQRRQIRALNEKAILMVTRFDVRGSTNVEAGGTWQRINWLLEEGFTRARIARELGCKTPALQLRKDFVTATSARKILALWRRYQ